MAKAKAKASGQVWNGSQWVNRLGATEPRPETEPETPPETTPETDAEDSDAENGDENDDET